MYHSFGEFETIKCTLQFHYWMDISKWLKSRPGHFVGLLFPMEKKSLGNIFETWSISEFERETEQTWRWSIGVFTKVM